MKIKIIAFDLWQTLAERKVDYKTLNETFNIFHPKISAEKMRSIFSTAASLMQNMHRNQRIF